MFQEYVPTFDEGTIIVKNSFISDTPFFCIEDVPLAIKKQAQYNVMFFNNTYCTDEEEIHEGFSVIGCERYLIYGQTDETKYPDIFEENLFYQDGFPITFDYYPTFKKFKNFILKHMKNEDVIFNEENYYSEFQVKEDEVPRFIELGKQFFSEEVKNFFQINFDDPNYVWITNSNGEHHEAWVPIDEIHNGDILERGSLSRAITNKKFDYHSPDLLPEAIREDVHLYFYLNLFKTDYEDFVELNVNVRIFYGDPIGLRDSGLFFGHLMKVYEKQIPFEEDVFKIYYDLKEFLILNLDIGGILFLKPVILIKKTQIEKLKDLVNFFFNNF